MEVTQSLFLEGKIAKQRQSQAVSEALSIIFGVASEASDSTAWFYCLERSMDVFDLAALHAI